MLYREPIGDARQQVRNRSGGVVGVIIRNRGGGMLGTKSATEVEEWFNQSVNLQKRILIIQKIDWKGR